MPINNILELSQTDFWAWWTSTALLYVKIQVVFYGTYLLFIFLIFTGANIFVTVRQLSAYNVGEKTQCMLHNITCAGALGQWFKLPVWRVRARLWPSSLKMFLPRPLVKIKYCGEPP